MWVLFIDARKNKSKQWKTALIHNETIPSHRVKGYCILHLQTFEPSFV